jgi:hypothetical protein
MSDPYFPIGPRGLRGTWRYDTVEEGRHHIEGFAVLARAIPHKGGRTFGYRVSDGHSTLAYVSDHEPTGSGTGSPDGLGQHHEAILALADGADLLIHDAQYRASELPAVAGLGHSTIEYTVGLAREARVRHLLLFHHAPNRTDDQVDQIVADLPSTDGLRVSAAAEGDMLQLGDGRR